MPIGEAVLDLRLWLLDLDRTGSMAQYHSVLAENFDSVAHIVDAYAEDGILDSQFFDDIGVSKLGHRRIFEQYFQKHYEDLQAGHWCVVAT